MLSLHLDSLSFSYESAVELLVDVSAHLCAGWTGVVGANGCGKSTLLQLIEGSLSPTAGRLRFDGADRGVHLCPQRVVRITEEISELASCWERPCARLRSQLNLDPDDVERWATLSPGERKRWQIGAALSAEPSVLLLDEPTNHLDGQAQALLLEALRRFDGIGVLVCHNRAFLDALTEHTLRVHHGRAQLYEGSYSAARVCWSREAEHANREQAELRKEKKKLKRRLHVARSSRAAAEANISPRNRMRSPADSDARSMARKGRAQKGEARAARKVTLTRRKFERVDRTLSGLHFDKEVGRSLFVDYAPCPRSRLVTFEADKVEIGNKTLLEDVSLWLDRDSRVHLRGPNGSGKTTLLKRLIQAANLPPNRVLLVPQTVSQHDAQQLLSDIADAPPDVRGRTLQLVAALGVDPGHLMASRAPSPGEALKMTIAHGLARQVWLVVLDEPTNHMDLPAIERLSQALDVYPGALILVSHDTALTDEITAERWDLENQRVIRACADP